MRGVPPPSVGNATRVVVDMSTCNYYHRCGYLDGEGVYKNGAVIMVGPWNRIEGVTGLTGSYATMTHR